MLATKPDWSVILPQMPSIILVFTLRTSADAQTTVPLLSSYKPTLLHVA